jgi:hypothetical protein
VWRRICAGAGRLLNRDAMHYGHRECNVTVPVIVARTGDHEWVVEAARPGRRWDSRVMCRLLRQLSPVVDLNDAAASNAGRLIWSLLRRPWLAAEMLTYGVHRLWDERGTVVRVLRARLRRKPASVRPLLLVVHRFMGAEELGTQLGRERLDACVFRVPVDGEMVSMCQVNASDIRQRLTQRRMRGRRSAQSLAAS